MNLKNTLKFPLVGGHGELDSFGNLYVKKETGLWRIDRNDNYEKITKGGSTSGGQSLASIKEKAKLEEVDISSCSWWTETEKGVFWCVSTTKNSRGSWFYQIHTEAGEIEPLSILVAPNYPPRLLFRSPSGPEVLFFDTGTFKAIDWNTKAARNIRTGHTNYDGIFCPSLLAIASVPCDEQCWTWMYIGTKGSSLSAEDSFWTYLLNIKTGVVTTIFNIGLHPLITIQPYLTLAVESQPGYSSTYWIVLVDWNPYSGSSLATKTLPNSRIKRLLRLDLDSLGMDAKFKFDASSNRLYCLGLSSITRFSNVFSISSSSSPRKMLYPPPITSFRPDMSLFLDPSLCSLPHDLQLRHLGSKTTWNIHYDILRHHDALKTPEGVDKLKKIVETSSLPSSSISAFLNFLYFSSPAYITDPTASFVPVCHCLQLCNQIGMSSRLSQHLLWMLERKIVPGLQRDFLISKILTFWFIEQDPSPESIATYSITSPLMGILASRYREIAQEGEIEEALKNFDFNAVTTPVSQLVGLGSSLTAFLSPLSSTKLLKPKIYAFPPYMASQPLEWVENLSIPSPTTPPNDPLSYIFSIEGRGTGGVVCNSLLLYAQWKWFERLVKMGANCVEVKTQHVVMPPELSPSALIAILSVPHGTYREVLTIPGLSTIDLAIVYRFIEQFQLPESPAFANFVEECKEILFSAVDENNCIEKLRMFWEAGIELKSRLFIDTLEVVRSNCEKLTMKAIMGLPFQLLAVVYAYENNPERFKSTKFSSIAGDLKQSLSVFEP